MVFVRNRSKGKNAEVYSILPRFFKSETGFGPAKVAIIGTTNNIASS